MTFYKSAADLPPFADYDMKGRTYRYFEGEPLFPFGHGLSYTRFEYSDLRLDRPTVGASDPLEASVLVKNVGKRAGDEVVQLYVRAVTPRRPRPLRELRGFERTTLKPGEEKRVAFRLLPRDAFAHWDEAAKSFAVDPGVYEIEVGASSRDLRVRGRVQAR